MLLLMIAAAQAIGGSSRRRHGLMKLFVFGDSYADTGNWPKGSATSWKEPYGITFPGEPSGRFSDGRVLTDYIASFAGIRPPLPYKLWKSGTKSPRHGMNFAHGGTGVFNTLVDGPNMTTQINFFQQLVEEKVYTKSDLNSSVALVSLGGNDYATYMALKGTSQGFPAFTKSVINQLATNLNSIHSLGVRKIGITAMEPLGCLPRFAALSSFQNCSKAENSLAKFHNQMLEQSLQKLSNKSNESLFLILDLYNAFMSVLKIQENHPGNTRFENPLKPCCVGATEGDFCGSVDKNGRKKYSVCENPKLSFFWDVIHPSQQGWHAVYSAFRSSLQQLV
ncbi:unnamed protein product [Ilex paraguariensis]|uniref:GDSL esterase/lipase n=1 Tax=Ilex paraguariensis TaxID=185542 RepID=A0ABC8V4Q4_9AQUA